MEGRDRRDSKCSGDRLTMDVTMDEVGVDQVRSDLAYPPGQQRHGPWIEVGTGADGERAQSLVCEASDELVPAARGQ
jgi:hypothetical protein